MTVANRQRKIKIDLRWLQEFARRAMVEVMRGPMLPGAVLPQLQGVEATIVSDATIARVHQDFMQIPGATDVITFDHGEILIGAETAQEHAVQFHQPIMHELGLYIIHGLLHLAGYDDCRPVDAGPMQRMQNEVLQRILRADGETDGH